MHLIRTASPARAVGAALVMLLAACATPALPSSMPLASDSALPSASDATPGEISRHEAVQLARDAIRPAGEVWDVARAEAGPLAEVVPDWERHEWGQALSADRPVWRVVLATDELSAEVVMDFEDGAVLGSTIGIAN